MNELQEVEFGLLKEFVKVCDKYNIKYFLVGGSCLGAVRHQGFIPWDDDIDVGMPRIEYDRFCEIAKKEFTGDVFFQSYETDPNYPYNFAKLRDSRTTYVETVYKFNNMNHGVWLDIFPFDGIQKKPGKITLKSKLHILTVWPKMWWLTPHCLTRAPRWKFFLTDLLIDLFMYPNYIWNVGHHQNKRIEKQMHKINYDDAYYVANMEGPWLTREIIKKEYFGEGTKLMFEGIEVRVPEHYHEFLTDIYGDYMKLPPENKRYAKHHTSYTSMTTPYKEFKKNYKKW